MQARTWEASLTSPACLCPVLSSTVCFSLQMVFRPPLDFYDVLIHLNPNQIPRHLESVDRPAKSVSRGVVKNSSAMNILFPVVDYDPVQLYLWELRVSMAWWGGRWGAKGELPCDVWIACHCRTWLVTSLGIWLGWALLLQQKSW